MRLEPAEAGTGIVFVRADAGGVEVPATLEYAGPSYYATVLQKDGLKVCTIEHLMAALSALQVDDLYVELQGPELPILDGSSLPFVRAIQEVGFQELGVERQYMTLIRPVVVSEKEKRIAAYPSSDRRRVCALVRGSSEPPRPRP